MRLFRQDKRLYLRRYIEGIEDEPTPEQRLGKTIHSALEDMRYPWLKEVVRKKKKVVRTLLDKMSSKKLPPEKEVVMTAKTKRGINLISIFDGFNKKNRILIEYKTSENEAWSQWIIDDHQQLSFYAYVYWLNYHAYLKEIILYFLNTKTGKIKTFKTVRSKRDLMYIADQIDQTVNEIKQAGLWEKRLSYKERKQGILL